MELIRCLIIVNSDVSSPSCLHSNPIRHVPSSALLTQDTHRIPHKRNEPLSNASSTYLCRPSRSQPPPCHPHAHRPTQPRCTSATSEFSRRPRHEGPSFSTCTTLLTSSSVKVPPRPMARRPHSIAGPSRRLHHHFTSHPGFVRSRFLRATLPRSNRYAIRSEPSRHTIP